MPRDPYKNFKFEVEIEGFVHAGFNKVSGLKHTIEMIEYREGAENETMRKLPGRSVFEPVTLERGQSDNSDFVDWINEIFNIDNIDGNQGAVEGFRRDVTIYLKNKAGTRVKKWQLFNAWPGERTDGDLDASANDVMTEGFLLHHEGLKKTNLV